MFKVQHELQETVNEMQETQEHLAVQINLLARNISELQSQLGQLLKYAKEKETEKTPTHAERRSGPPRTRAPPLTAIASHPSNATVDTPTLMISIEDSNQDYYVINE